MRLLGALAPNTEAGTKYGAASAAVAAVVLRKSRRERPFNLGLMRSVMAVSPGFTALDTSRRG